MHMETEIPVEQPHDTNFPYKHYAIASAVLCSFFFFLYVFYIFTSPISANDTRYVSIPNGATASAISILLEEERIVRSSTLLYFSLILFAEPEAIKAGNYTFTTRDNVYDVAKTITAVAPPSSVVTITFPEGFSSKEYAKIASKVLSNIDSEQFENLASQEEGYLFPDTYYVPLDFTTEELIELTKDTFETKTNDITFTQPQYDTLILASILEREANSLDSMQMVAGVMRNRLELGMPLQADASIEYVLDKPLSELTPADLKIDSPYNTYINRGLPPTPIGNPGLDSIRAILNPTKHNFLFYITGNDGNFYYANSLEEHNRNIARYLR